LTLTSRTEQRQIAQQLIEVSRRTTANDTAGFARVGSADGVRVLDDAECDAINTLDSVTAAERAARVGAVTVVHRRDAVGSGQRATHGMARGVCQRRGTSPGGDRKPSGPSGFGVHRRRRL
jgi:hypothetical protein